MADDYLTVKLKWLCLYSIKGRFRYLDIFKLYFDGGLDKFPTGSVCLDDPIILLDPKHPKFAALRPSHIARSCDLFADENCYHVLKLVEERIAVTANFKPKTPVVFVITGLNSEFQPAEIYEMPHAEAIGLFTAHAQDFQLPGAIRASDPAGPLLAKFAAHAADLRIKTGLVRHPRMRPHFRGVNFET